MPRAQAAVTALQTAAAGSSADPTALVALGEWYAFRGRPDWAADFFARAAAAGADTPALVWGRCAWLCGDTASASRLIRVARARGKAPNAYLTQCLRAISRH
jgi:Flp pilus assembly protein TadD